MNNWVVVIAFSNPQEAYLAKGMLESYEIESVINDDLVSQVNNFLSNAIGGVKLLVRSNQAEQALSLLKQSGYINEEPAPKVELELFSAEFKDKCPYCGSDNVIKMKRPSYAFLLSILLFGAPIPLLKKTYYCFDCTKEWKC